MLTRKSATLTAIVFALCLQTALLAGQTFHATVQGIGSGTVSLMSDSGELKTYPVQAGARIMRNSKVIKLQELRQGDAATITTEMKNSRAVVTSIVAMAQQ